MNKDLLKAFSDISTGMEEIYNFFKKKPDEKSSSKIIADLNVGKQLESISNNIKEIKSDIKTILKNQLNLSTIAKKENSKTKLFETVGKEKIKNIKDGVSAVVLIATGVLAIGAAFKLIGQVNFASVIALSISLPLVAIAFEKIAKLKDLNFTNMKSLLMVVSTMSLSLLISSCLLSKMATLTPGQGITAILISGMFALIGLNINKFLESSSKLNRKNIFNLPILFLGVSTAIMLASQVMRGIQPITLGQGITAILIAGTFAVIGYTIDKIAKSLKDVDAKNIWKMPLILFAVGTAITAASFVMNKIIPIRLEQGITAILIAGTFAIIGYGVQNIVKGIKDVKLSDMLVLPFVLFGFSTAIMLSSHVMQKIMPIKLDQGLTAIAISAVFAVISLSLPALSYAVKNTSLATAAKMTAILPLLAAALTASSFVMKKMVSIDNGLLFNSVLQALALSAVSVALGGAMFLLSKMGVGLGDIIKGSLMIVAISTTMMVSSHILSLGNYEKYPSLNWAMGVGASLLGFGINAMLLGAVVMLGGEELLFAGAFAVLGLSAVVVAASAILNNGNYEKYPSLSWATGVGASLLGFGINAMLLGAAVLMTGGIGAAALLIGSGAILGLSAVVVATSAILNSGNYEKYPSLSWSMGVGASLLGFGVGAALLGGIILTGVGAAALYVGSKAILKLSSVVVATAVILNGGNYEKYPSLSWATGVGASLLAFGASAVILAFQAPLIVIGAFALMTITGAIVASSLLLGSGDFTKGPTKDWSDGLTNSINGFISNASLLNDINVFSTSASILAIAGSISLISKMLKGGDYSSVIPDGYMKSLSDNIKMYIQLSNYIQENNNGPLSFLNTLSVTSGVNKMVDGYAKLSKTIKTLGDSINGIDVEKLNSMKLFSGTMVLMSTMDSELFGKMMDKIEEKTGIFVKVMETLEPNTSSIKSKLLGLFDGVKSSTSQSVSSNTDDVVRELQKLSAIMSDVSKNTKSMSSYFDSIRTNNINVKNKKHM